MIKNLSNVECYFVRKEGFNSQDFLISYEMILVKYISFNISTFPVYKMKNALSKCLAIKVSYVA